MSTPAAALGLPAPRAGAPDGLAGPPGPTPQDVAAVLAAPDRLAVWFQPIIDTVTGRAAGWEALSRFVDADGERSRWGPADWFAAAQGLELGAHLEALALRRALGSLPGLPPDTFLTVNVSPAAITTAAVAQVLAEHTDLSRVIIEITETDAMQDVGQVSSVCAGIRAAGGTVAVDDAGAGYAGLALIAHLRPQLVKVDRELVSGCDTDPVKLSLMEVLGVWASGMDAWLLAEGVETVGEYAAVVALGVPLVQGYLTGRPAPEPVGPDDDTFAELRRQRARVALQGSVAAAMATWPVVPVAPGTTPADALRDPARVADLRPGAGQVLAQGGWPLALALPHRPVATTAGLRVAPVSLRVRPSEDTRAALQRAMARDPEHRFDPLVVTDPQGVTVGVVTVEALVASLTAAAER